MLLIGYHRTLVMTLKKIRQKRTRNSLVLAISAVACSPIHLFKENPPLRLKVESQQKKKIKTTTKKIKTTPRGQRGVENETNQWAWN